MGCTSLRTLNLLGNLLTRSPEQGRTPRSHKLPTHTHPHPHPLTPRSATVVTLCIPGVCGERCEPSCGLSGCGPCIESHAHDSRTQLLAHCWLWDPWYLPSERFVSTPPTQAHAWLDRGRHEQDNNNRCGGHLSRGHAAGALSRPTIWTCAGEGERSRVRCDAACVWGVGWVCSCSCELNELPFSPLCASPCCSRRWKRVRRVDCLGVC